MDKAQGGIGLGVVGEVVIEVHGVIAPHAEDAAALGWPSCRCPEPLETRQRPGSQRPPRREASLEHLPTTHTLHDPGMSLRCFHRSLSFVRRTGWRAQPYVPPTSYFRDL